jgi:DNA-binding SARP family transcriptional activator/tetratricopeptide (TPR) repeat protein
VHFGILGPLDAREGTEPVQLHGGRLARLLAILLVRANEVVSTDRLTEDLWDGQPPSNAAATLHTYVSRIRTAFGPNERDRLVTRRPGYLLRIEADELDATRFEQLVSDARRALIEGEPARAVELLDVGMGLWRGDALTDFADASFARVEATRLMELREQAVEDRADAQLALGLGSDLVPELERRVSDQPLRERRWAQLMLALYRANRQADALRKFQELRRVLGEELGIEPSPDLVRLESDILLQQVAEPEPPPLEPRREPPIDARTDAASGVAEPADRRPSRRGAGRVRAAAPQLVGRGAELEFLRATLDDVAGDVRSLVVVSGEPGIGKTALLSAFAAEVRAAGSPVLWGRCDEEALTPYQPFVEALRDWAVTLTPDEITSILGANAPELARHVPALAAVVADRSDSERLDPETQRYRWFEAVAATLTAILDHGSGVLVLDDAHWADVPTLRLLRHVLRHRATTRLLVIAIVRSNPPGSYDETGAVLADIRRDVEIDRLELEGLEVADVAAVLEAGAARPLGDAGVALAQAVHDASDGNALFVSELTRHLRDSGTLDGLDNEHPSVQLGPVGIPASIRDVVARRIARLEPASRELLQLAAVFGPEFDPDVLRQVAGTDRDRMADALDEGERAHMVASLGSARRYAFCHAILREAMYVDVSAVRRQTLHAQITSVLETLHRQRPEEYLPLLAYHACEAVPAIEPEAAIDYARRAGDDASSRVAHEVAALHYERALDVIHNCGIDDRLLECQLHLAVGEAHNRAGDVPIGKESFRTAAEIARGEGRADLLARAAQGYGGPVAATPVIDDPLTVALLDEALEALGPEPASARALALGRLAQWLYGVNDPDRRRDLCIEAIAIARSLDDPATLALVLHSRYWALYGPDDVDERLDVADEIAAIGDRLDLPELVLQGTQCRVHALIERGDWTAAEAAAAKRTALARALRQPQYLWTVTTYDAMLAATQGRLAEAEELATAAFVMRRRTDEIGAIAVYVAQMQQVRWLQGRMADIVPIHEQLVARDPERPTWHSALAWARAEAGDVTGAAADLELLASRGLATLPRNFEWLPTISGIAIATWRLQNKEVAAELYPILLPYAERNCVAGQSAFYGSVSHHLGTLAETLGQDDVARAHFEAALRRHEQFRSPPLVELTKKAMAGS